MKSFIKTISNKHQINNSYESQNKVRLWILNSSDRIICHNINGGANIHFSVNYRLLSWIEKQLDENCVDKHESQIKVPRAHKKKQWKFVQLAKSKIVTTAVVIV